MATDKEQWAKHFKRERGEPHWSKQTKSEWLYSAYRRERRRLLSNCHAHRKGFEPAIGRHTRKFRQLELLRFRMAWAQVCRAPTQQPA